MTSLRRAVGLRKVDDSAAADPSPGAAAPAQAAPPSIKQYRETDGLFYFKLKAADGTLLLQSHGFAEGREAGGWVKRLKTEGAAALADGAPVTPLVDRAVLDAALAALVAAGQA